jgi:hypothetical protein
MFGDLPGPFDGMKNTFTRRVIAKNVQRIFAKMESRLAGHSGTLVDVFFPSLVLVSTTPHILVKTLIPCDCLRH